MQISDNVSMFNGLNVSNNTSMIGTLHVKDNVSMLNGLNVFNNVSIVGQMRISDNVSIFNGLNVSNNTSLIGKLYVSDITNLESKLNVSDTISCFNGLNISNNTSIVGNLYVTQSTILKSTLNVSENVSFLNTLTVSNNTSLLAQLQVMDNAQFMKGINVNENTSLLGNLNTIGTTKLESSLHVDGNASFFSGINVTGDAFLKNDLNVEGGTQLNTLTTDGLSTFNGLASFTNGINVTNGIESDRLYTTGNASINGKLIASILVYGELRSVTGYNAFSGPAISLEDFDGFDEKGDVLKQEGNATFGGTGHTTINNNLRINSQSIQIIGKGTTRGIEYEGPINVSTTGGETNNQFRYEGPFNISTLGTDNQIKYGGDLTLYGDLRIKTGHRLIIESSSTITEIETKTQVSDVLEITNDGTGPALVLNQIDTNANDIAYFQDNGINVITIADGGNTTIKGSLKVGYTPASTFNSNGATLDISGSCSISGDLNLAGNVISQSDRRIKTNINPIYNCLEKINTISGYTYNRPDLDNEKHIGLIAQEVEELFPELVTETNNIKGINYQGFIAVLLNCIKELNKKIEKIENIEKK